MRRRVKQMTAAVAMAAMVLALPNLAAIGQESSCESCHANLEERLSKPYTQWQGSIHKEKNVSCHDCHGGDPHIFDDNAMKTSDFIGIPKLTQIPEMCAKCHANPDIMKKYLVERIDQYALYKSSVHGKLLYEKSDPKVATCVSCHSVHDIVKVSDPTSPVYHTSVPQTCAKCHSNAEYMAEYKIPTTQYQDYLESYHGQILMGKVEGRNPALVPNCATCHGTHGAAPPGLADIPEVCGTCHSNTAEEFKKGPHGKAFQEVGGPRCVDCHTNHKNKVPTPDMFTGEEEGHCGNCHDESSEQYKIAQTMRSMFENAQKAMTEADAELKRIEGHGFNIDALLLHKDTAFTQFVEAGPITHSLSLQAVKDKLDQAVNECDAVVKQTNNYLGQLKWREYVGSLIIALLLLIAFLLYVKRRILMKQYELEKTGKQVRA